MANYAESLLASGERVLRRAHQHWFVFVCQRALGVFALIASAVLDGAPRLAQRHGRDLEHPRLDHARGCSCSASLSFLWSSSAGGTRST